MKKIFFLVTKPPFKTENVRHAVLHAVGCYTVIDEEVEPVVGFVGKGALNCVSNQEAERFYGIESNGDEIKKLLLSEAEVLICEEDVNKFGIEGRLVDAKEFDVDTEIRVAPFEEIQGVMKKCDHLMVF